MKKILVTIVLASILVGVAAPLVVSAQTKGLRECCTLRQVIRLSDDAADRCGKDSISAPSRAAAGACGTGLHCPNSAKRWGMFCMFNTIYSATNWLFMILVLLSVLFIIVGGFTYITASGDPEKAGKGGKIIVYALIGLAIALFAKVIPSIVRFIMGL